MKYEKFDSQLVEKYVKKYKIKVPKGASLEVLADSLQKYFVDLQATAPANVQFAECDCGGLSVATLEECPFCGDSEDVDFAPETETNAETMKAGDTKAPAKKSSDKKLATKKPATKKVATKKVATKKPATKKVAKAAKPRTTSPATKSEALPARSPKKNKLTSATLDEQCDVVRLGIQAAGENLWDIGNAFREIQEHELWKLRLDDEGLPSYKNFASFLAREFHVSAAYVQTLIRGVKTFDKKQVSQMGFSGMQLALVAKSDTKTKDDDVADDAATTSTKAPPATDAPPSQKKITVAIVEGQVELKAYKRMPAGFKGDPVRATQLKEDPHAALVFENGVTQYIRMGKDVNGDIVFVVQFEREN